MRGCFIDIIIAPLSNRISVCKRQSAIAIHW
jgi:hypothetical protein